MKVRTDPSTSVSDVRLPSVRFSVKARPAMVSDGLEPPVNETLVSVMSGCEVAPNVPSKVTLTLVALAALTRLLPVPTVANKLSAAWILEASVAATVL